MGREIFLSVCFYILVCGAAECDGCQSLAIFDGYFIAGNTYLSCTTGPGEFVRSVNTVFQLSFAVYLIGRSTGIGLYLDSSAGVVSLVESFVVVVFEAGVGFVPYSLVASCSIGRRYRFFSDLWNLL